MAKAVKEFENIDELYALCENSAEPCVITKNKDGKLVIMSLTDYEEERLYNQRLYNSLKKATAEYESGAPLMDAFDFLTEMRARYVEK